MGISYLCDKSLAYVYEIGEIVGFRYGLPEFFRLMGYYVA
jgi:hypothetical protein